MRRLLLLVLLLAACGSETKPVERAFSWRAGAAERVMGAVALPGGGYYVNVLGEAPRGRFLSDDGAVRAEAAFDFCEGCEPAQPLVVGDAAFFAPVAGGEPILVVDPRLERVAPLPLQNPRGLPIGAFFLDGRRAAQMASGKQMLLPGERLLELSVEGIVTESHPTPPSLAVAHAQEDVYAFVTEELGLAGFRDGDRAVTDFELPAVGLAGGDGFTVLALLEAGRIHLRLYQSMHDLEAAFAHEVALSASAQAERVLVGVLDRPLDGPPPEEGESLPDPGTILFLDGSGKRLGRFEAPAPIVAVHLDEGGERAIVAHEKGVSAFELR